MLRMRGLRYTKQRTREQGKREGGGVCSKLQLLPGSNAVCIFSTVECALWLSTFRLSKLEAFSQVKLSIAKVGIDKKSKTIGGARATGLRGVCYWPGRPG